VDVGLLINPKAVDSVWANESGVVAITMRNGEVFTIDEVTFDEVAAKLNGESTSSKSLTKDDQERGKNAVARDVLEVFVGIGVESRRKAAQMELAEAEKIHARLFRRKSGGGKMVSAFFPLFRAPRSGLHEPLPAAGVLFEYCA
jgi:hypothetical protein